MKKSNINSRNIESRAKTILSEVVDTYLNIGQPVSSKIISQKLNSYLSSSTIRLADDSEKTRIYGC